MKTPNRYTRILEKIFHSHFRAGAREIEFEREEIVRTARKLKIKLPKNLGDVVYTFRYRSALPESIRKRAKTGEIWIIRPAGRAKYRMVLVPDRPLTPNPNMAIIKVPDSTPGVVAKYGFSDEQALLAKVRYNRLVDIFAGVACYSLQNHLRTTVPDVGQVETDEIHAGVDKKGSALRFPGSGKREAGTVEHRAD